MKIVFFGSSKYSVIDAKEIHEKIGVSLLVTLPDRQNTKSKKLIPNPVKKFGIDNTIPVITAEKLTPDIVEQIKQVTPDFLVVADFGLILPKSLLELPQKAAINVHHSLLPKYRGPAPVPFAILAGEETVGVTIILMTPKVDAGDILAQEKYALRPTDTTDSVLTKLNEIGSRLAVQVIENFDDMFAKRIPQNESEATFTHYMKRADGYVSEKTESVTINRMIRAYFPWPGVWTLLRLKATEEQATRELRVKFLPNNMVQVEGKKPQSYKDFLNGYPQATDFLQKLGLI